MTTYAEWLRRTPTNEQGRVEWEAEGREHGWLDRATADSASEPIPLHPPIESSRRRENHEPPAQISRPEIFALGDYLAAVETFARRYVAFPSEHEPVAVALWVAQAWLAEHVETSPILAVTSAEMRSGKTRLLDCLELLVPHPERSVLPSESVVYTLLTQDPRPTLLIDEADAIFGNRRQAERYEGVRAILNAGNRKGTTVPRVRLDGRKRGVERFDAYGPKAIAGIGDLPATVADRAIPIRLKRRAPDERVAKFRRRRAEAEAAAIRFDASAVSLPAEVAVPDELPDRAADAWEVLLAIAEAAAGDWPRRARLAALALSGEEAIQVTTGIRLLTDIRDVFEDADHLPTAELLRRLNDLDDAPWSEWYGQPLTARGLAKLLEPYGVTPLLRRLRGERRRGYFRADFADAWRRYVDTGAPVTSVTSVPADDAGTGVTGVTVAQVGNDGLFDPEFATHDDGEGVA
ncbi:MAG: DUF3631 domain-containing protein [Chloroflexota bacterium]|nr:DUF3631 domain-containing protein [Chloroflexota bacterium]